MHCKQRIMQLHLTVHPMSMIEERLRTDDETTRVHSMPTYHIHMYISTVRNHKGGNFKILWCIASNHSGQWSATLVKGEGAVALNSDKNVQINSFISISIVCNRNERIYIPSFLLHTIVGSFMMHPLQNLPFHTVQGT